VAGFAAALERLADQSLRNEGLLGAANAVIT